MSSTPISKWTVLPWILLCECAGIIGTFFTSSAIPTWYAALEKPALNPPSWLFGPVWTMLYALMGIAAFLVWRRGFERPDVKRALVIFGGQLLLNTTWSILFFGLRNPLIALMNIILLWILIVLTIIVFFRIVKPSAYLLIPYLLWVSFATYLNWSIYLLN